MDGSLTQPMQLRFERLTFEQGNEFAPDASWEYQRVALSSDGQLEFEQRQGGYRRLVRGRVNRERVGSVRDQLARTNFPIAPETRFLPGSSVITLTLEQPAQRMFIDYFTGLKLDGYRELIRDLSALNNALRESNTDVLTQWEFVASTGGADGT